LHILVTGGAGFIGTNLCRRLVRDGHRVRVLDDFSTGYRSNLASLDVELLEGTILDAATVERAVDGVDSVMHLAARGSVPRSVEDPVRTHEVNATGTLNVLVAGKAAGAYVAVASSSSVYGANEALPKREDMLPMPKSPYAVSKLATEAYALAFQRTYGMPTLAFRFFNVFGPYQSARHPYAAVVPAFVAAMLDGESLVVHGDGTQSRDFTAVESVVNVLTDALTRQVVHHGPVNLAFGTNTSLLDLIARITKSLGLDEPSIRFGPPRVGDVRASSAEHAILMDLFGTAAVPVPLSEGLDAVIKWFQETGGRQE